MATPVDRREETRLDQPVAEVHRVVTGCRDRPEEPRAGRSVSERLHVGKGPAQGVALPRRHQHVGHRLVEARAVAVQLREASRVARQGPPLARRPSPCAVGVDVEVYDGVSNQRLTHALGLHGAAAQGDHRGVAAVQQLADHLFLARAIGVLPLAIEEGLDRLAQRQLELPVGVDGGASELGRDGARAGRLAGTHEADQHYRAVYARLHPIRST